MFWLIGASVFIAALVGGANASDLFAYNFIGIYLAVWVISYLVLRWLVVLGLAPLAIGAWIAMVVVMFMSGQTFKYIGNDLPTYTQAKSAEVTFSYDLDSDGEKTGSITFVNHNPDALRELSVECTMRWDNGQPVDRIFAGGVSGTKQYAMGHEFRVQVINPMYFTTYRSKDFTCGVVSAEFVKTTGIKTDLYWTTKADGFTEFMVTNREAFPIQNVQFNCIDRKGYSVKVIAFPAYLTDRTKATILEPGETVKFLDNAKWYSYVSCSVSNAKAA